MKKFDADGQSNSPFDFAGTGRELELALNEGAKSSSDVRCMAWDVDFLRAIAPLPKIAPAKHGIYRRMGKRLLDCFVILASLPFALPVIAICAIALWIEGGLPFYTQQRIGRNGKRFSILKLRTMVRDADQVLEDYLANDPKMRAEWETLQKLKNDPRVTRVGAFLRATSLDELPQLFNVLKGDMSLVGPRPMMLDQEDLYGDMRAYTALRPGITGLWQVSARNGNTFRYRNEVDAAYERSLKVGNDLAILAKTVSVVLRGTGY